MASHTLGIIDMKTFATGDLVRYRQGSFDEKGLVVGYHRNDYRVLFFSNNKVVPCRWRNLTLLGKASPNTFLAKKFE
jgi:hypothetical protein